MTKLITLTIDKLIVDIESAARTSTLTGVPSATVKDWLGRLKAIREGIKGLS